MARSPALPAGTGGRRKAPFSDQALCDRAKSRWTAARLTPLGLHEARHTFASMLLAAGVQLKVVSALMGHTTVAITGDLLAHRLPGAGEDAIGQLDRFLGATTRSSA